MGSKLEQLVSVLNGAIGDHLARTENGLATEMTFIGEVPTSPRVVILVHGLMCTEAIWKMPDGEDYGTRLQKELGYSPLYVRYNSGLSIEDSGAQLDRLIASIPVPDEIVFIGYSMGGLVVRSACRAAKTSGSAWLSRVRRAIYVGTPHDGAPLERVGRVVGEVLRRIPDPYTRLVAQIAELRSRGIKDLGDGDPVPLPDHIEHFLVAGALGEAQWASMLLGDGIVPVASATHPGLPPERVVVMRGLSHLALPHHPDVLPHLARFLR